MHGVEARVRGRGRVGGSWAGRCGRAAGPPGRGARAPLGSRARPPWSRPRRRVRGGARRRRGRRDRRPRDRLEPHGPAGANGRRVVDARVVRGRAPRDRPRGAPETGFTARIDLAGLPPGQTIVYRVLFQDLRDLRAWSLPVAGLASARRRPGAARRAPRLVGRHGRPGLGHRHRARRPAQLRDDAAARARPVRPLRRHDLRRRAARRGACRSTTASIWRNLVTPAKSKVAETLEEFRGNYLYNLLDENVRRFNAEVAQVMLWDDHEVLNNWYPTELLEDSPLHREERRAARRPRAARLPRARPIRHAGDDPERIYRTLPLRPPARRVRDRHAQLPRAELAQHPGHCRAGDGAPGPRAARLAEGAARAPRRAAWKVVASDMPLGLVVKDGPTHFEAVANGDGGPPSAASWRSPSCCASSNRARAQRRVDHRRRPLRRGPPLPPGARALHRLPALLGVRRRARSTPARSGPTPSTRPSAPRCASSASPRG